MDEENIVSKKEPPAYANGRRKVLVLVEPYFLKQQGESSGQFDAFVRYRDMPRGEREIIEVAKRLKKHPHVIYRWSARNKWKVRAEAYDLKQDQDYLAIVEKSRKERFELEMQLAQGMATVGGAHIQMRLDQIKAREENPEVEFNMSDKDAERWIDSGIKWMRTLDNLPTGHVLIETPEMMKERLLREAVADITELHRMDPKISLEQRVKWAVEDYPGLDFDLLSSAVHGHIEQVSAMEN